MSQSAFVGNPPNTERDALIIKGWYQFWAFPYPGDEFGIIPALKPPNPPHDSRQTYTVVVCAIAITLTIVITGARLLLRIFMKEMRWGADDWTILVAASGVVGWFGLTTAAGINGGGGKRLYDVTYEELNIFIQVCPAMPYTLFAPFDFHLPG